MDAADGRAEPLDEAAADRERGVERDLLRRDRGDEALERVGRERRPEPREPLDELREHRLGSRPDGEGVELERKTEEPLDDRPGEVVERLDVYPARGRPDHDLSPADSAMESAVDPEVRAVRPEHPEPLGRELEVVRVRKAQQQRASRVSNASNGRPSRSSVSASQLRAKTRSAASAAQ